MLNIYICEDNESHRKQIEECVSNCITINNYDMKLAISTHDPRTIEKHLSTEKASGLYFLDIELNHEINGITLAEIIREYDSRGFIVFITTHNEALPLMFKHKLEAMDFIFKDDFVEGKDRIYECISNANKRFSAKAMDLHKVFTFRLYDKIMTINYADILFFETYPSTTHKIILYTMTGKYEFPGRFNILEKELHTEFYRCHQSYIVNVIQIVEIDVPQKQVILKNGSKCSISRRKIKELREMLSYIKL